MVAVALAEGTGRLGAGLGAAEDTAPVRPEAASPTVFVAPEAVR